MSRRTLRTRHEPGENPTTPPRHDPSNAEPLASPCRSGLVLRSPVNKWRKFRFAFLSLFFTSAFFCVLFIQFIGNKFGQYARIIFACFVHLFAVDSAHSHTHAHTPSQCMEFIKCAVVSRFRVLPNGRHISERCHLAPHKDDKSS